MRPVRPLLAAAALTALVLAGCSFGQGSRSATSTRPDGLQPATPSTASTPAGAPTETVRPAGLTTSAAGQPTAAQAVATARAFLAREVGMTNLVAGPFRSTGARTGEVGFRPKFGEGGRRLPQTGPAAAVVRLYRLAGGWMVLGVRGRSIQVGTPGRLQRIGSPVTVTGKASAYEGTVYVKVTQDRSGKDLVLGQGFVTGSGDATLGPFGGRIAFRQPTAAAGWVIFYEEGAASGGGVVQATAVRVRFTPAQPAPRILAVTTKPTLRTDGGFLVLPNGAGTLVVSVKATHTKRVRFLLTPTGTDVARYARLLGHDTSPADGFTLAWAYRDEPLLAHLTVQAVGPGGTTEQLIGIHHADP